MTAAPLYPSGVIGEEAGLIASFFLGLFFGFFLERAGFGSARKLTSIFYLKDWSVLRVMFTAIVVAMLGLLYFTGAGWMDGEGITPKDTVLGAQLIGGLLLGAGFIIGGYCPGTSAVAAASGKLDALAYLAGLLAGTFVFSGLYDSIQPLYQWGVMGAKTLPEVLGIHPGAVAAAVVAIALAAFLATEVWGNPSNPAPRVWQLRMTPQRAAAATLVLLAFGIFVGYGMASRVKPAEAAAAVAATPVAREVSTTPATAVSSPAPTPLAPPPGGVKKFKKAKSCS